MKGILEFTLPEERGEFEDAQNGWKWQCVVDSYLNEYLRPLWKHGQEGEPKATWAEEARDKLYEAMNDYNVDLD